MTKTATKILSLTLCLLLALSVVAVVGLSLNATASADGGASEGGTVTPVANVPTFTVIGGQNKPSDSNGQDYLVVYDGDTDSKYCIDIKATPYVTFQASDVGTVVTGYTLYTGDDTQPDHTGRNPKAWKLEGSIDGANWTEIHSITDDDKLPTVENKEGCVYTFDNTTPYWYYKITFTARQGEVGAASTKEYDYNLMQISEMEFTATAAPVAEVDTEQEFTTAVEAGGSIKLVGDVTLTAELEIYQKAVSIDLNGYVLSGAKISVYGAAASSSSVLVLSDSRPTATHPGTSLPNGGVVENELHLTRKTEDETYSNRAYLYANGGTVTQKLYCDTGAATVDYIGERMTTFKGGMQGAGSAINAGLYYGEVVSYKEDNPLTIKNKKVIFKNGDTTYATQILRSGDKATIPTTPTNEGYEFVKWYNSGDNSDFNSASTVTADCTIKAMWLKEVATLDDLQGEINKDNSVRLTADITLTGDITVKGGKNIILDLNGHVIDGDKKLYGTGNGGTENPGPSTKLTIIDSNPTATHQDASLPIGGCLNVEISVTASSPTRSTGAFHLHANGGTIKKVHCPSYACYIYWSGSNKPSTIGAITGSSDGKANPTVRGGLFYYNQGVDDNPTTGDKTLIKVTYTSDGKVYAVLAMNGSTPNKKAVVPVVPKLDGHTFVGWYANVESENPTLYDFSTPLTASITLDAGWVPDVTAPIITGVNGDDHYCTDQMVIITDDSNVTVKVDETPVTLSNDRFVLDMSSGTDKTIVVTDSKGNETTLVVKFGHSGSVDYVWSQDNSTCTATRVCTMDGGHRETETVNATPSTSQEQSCTNAELTTYVATFENSAFAEQTKANVQTEDALGHNSEGSVAHKDANCTEAGVVGGTYCTRCNDGKTAAEATIPAKGHTFGDLANEVPANCTETGTKAHKDCSVCNKHFDADGNEIADLVIPALGHKFGDWVEEVAATSKVEGVKGHKDCSVCNKHFDADGNEIADLVIEKLPKEGLSGGAIAAIAVGGTVVAGAGGFSIVWFIIKKRSFAELLAAAKGIFHK